MKPKDLFIKRLANLLSIKSLVTLALTAVFAYLAAIQVVEIKDVFLIVIGFYFGTQTDKDGNALSKNKEE